MHMVFIMVGKKFLEGVCHVTTSYPSENVPIAHGNKQFQ